MPQSEQRPALPYPFLRVSKAELAEQLSKETPDPKDVVFVLWTFQEDTSKGQTIPAYKPEAKTFLIERSVLVQMARDILRTFEPTTEQQILSALERIETELKSSEPPT